MNMPKELTLQDRAKECARAMRALAVENPMAFANETLVALWFEAVLMHEKTLADPAYKAIADMAEALELYADTRIGIWARFRCGRWFGKSARKNSPKTRRHNR